METAKKTFCPTCGGECEIVGELTRFHIPKVNDEFAIRFAEWMIAGLHDFDCKPTRELLTKFYV